MPGTTPVPQCTLIMTSGKRCGGVAMRGKRFCYHHTGSHRQRSRERILGERLDRLGVKMDAMDTAELLCFLYQKLGTMTKTCLRFPEVGYTLTYALDRLGEVTSLEATLRLFLTQNQQFAARAQASRNDSSNLQRRSLESVI